MRKVKLTRRLSLVVCLLSPFWLAVSWTPFSTHVLPLLKARQVWKPDVFVTRPQDAPVSAENATDECSSHMPELRSKGKIFLCEQCNINQQPVHVKIDDKRACVAVGSVRTTCLRDELIDGIVWDGNNYPANSETSPVQRNENNSHQIWFAYASEAHAPPYWPRPIGDTAWMKTMNYARYYGPSTDFPVDYVPGYKTWPLVDQSVIEGKTHWILYMASNCETQSERDDFVQRASLHMDITSVGTCVNNAQVHTRIKHLEEDENGESLRVAWKDYETGAQAILASYRFRLLILSTLCVDYWAEKVMQTLLAGVIPIYLGMPNSHDWDPGIAAGVHPAMIHVQDFDGFSELSSFIHELGADTEEARQRRQKYYEYQKAPPSMFPRHGERFFNKSDGGDWYKFICERLYGGDVERRIRPQLPCQGTWWQYFESLGKNLTKWGCTADWPCATKDTSSNREADSKSEISSFRRLSF